MAKRIVKSQAEQQYNKELNRIKRFIKRAENRGYRFDSDVIPDRPKRVTKASVSKLKKLTPSVLYKKSTALSESGKVITGTQRRKEERTIATKKGAQTRRERLRKVERKNNKFESERRKQDEVETERLKSDEEYQRLFNEGKIIYDRILGMIETVARDHKKAADSLLNTLAHEIATYGEDSVFRSIGNAPQECIELADIALRYNPGHPKHDGAIRELQMLITGTIPTAEEMRDLQDAIEADTYTDVEG